MSQKTRNQLYTEINTGITDALNQQITPVIVRNILTDMVDSGINISDGATASSIFGSPGAINNGVGTIILASPGSVITFGVTNSAIIGGSNITLTQSNVIYIGGNIINASQSLANILLNGNDTGPTSILMGTGSALYGYSGYTNLVLNDGVGGVINTPQLSAFEPSTNNFTKLLLDPSNTSGTTLNTTDVTFGSTKYSEVRQSPQGTKITSSDEFGANTYLNAINVRDEVQIRALDPSTGSQSNITLNNSNIYITSPNGLIFNNYTNIISSGCIADPTSVANIAFGNGHILYASIGNNVSGDTNSFTASLYNNVSGTNHTLDQSGDNNISGNIHKLTNSSWNNISGEAHILTNLSHYNIVMGKENILSGVTSSAILASNINATQSNTVYTNNIKIEGTNSALTLSRLTTTQRNALTADNGMLIYNTTLNKFQGYENGAWVNLI